MANSASFSAVFGAHSNAGAPFPAAPWPPVPSGQLAMMPHGAPPPSPHVSPPNCPYSTPASSGGGGNGSANSAIGCKEDEVQRCDSKGKRHSRTSDNTHNQILSGDIVDLRALTAVYGSGLCPGNAGMLSSPQFHMHFQPQAL